MSGEWTPPRVAARVAEIFRKDQDMHKQAVWIDTGLAVIDDIRADLEIHAGECGTTGCAAGWAAILIAPAQARLMDKEYGLLQDIQFPDGEVISIKDLGQQALGLTSEQAAWLFDQDRTAAEVLVSLDEIAAGETITLPANYTDDEDN